MVGATIAVAFGAHQEQCFTLDELVQLYYSPWVAIEFALVIALLTFFYIYAKRAEAILAKVNGHSSLEYQKYASLHPVCYAGLAGIWGGQTCLFAKVVISLGN